MINIIGSGLKKTCVTISIADRQILILSIIKLVKFTTKY